MWFSNRRAKWRREEKLRTHRRDIDSVGAVGGTALGGVAAGGLGACGGGAAAGSVGRMASSMVNGACAAPSGFAAAAAANGVYHAASLVHQPLASMAAAAAVADQYRYPESVYNTLWCSFHSAIQLTFE